MLTLVSTPSLFDPLALPSGGTLPNRIAKAAMEENLAGPGQLPDAKLFTLYEAWSRGGAGLLITGNVMVDGRALTGPAGVVLEAATPLEPFERWAQAAKSGGSRVWMQLNHPGRQVYAEMRGLAWSPSGVALELGGFSKLFAQPVAMTTAQIAETVGRFAATALQAQRAGFDGVQIHAAHGYLLSQFLSPLVNRRTDAYGGEIANRARMLMETVAAVRAVVRPDFTVAVKLNSADFQRGGFDHDDALAVVAMLGEARVDCVELSGGSYESPAMQGRTADARTLAREAYFLEFAIDLGRVATMPLMVTGGIRSRAVAERVLASGVAAVGLATALALAPDLPDRWRMEEAVAPRTPATFVRSKSIAALAEMAYTVRQLRRLSSGRTAKASLSPTLSLVLGQLRRRRDTRRYRAWLAAREGSRCGATTSQ